jgi:hypothetical protein
MDFDQTRHSFTGIWLSFSVAANVNAAVFIYADGPVFVVLILVGDLRTRGSYPEAIEVKRSFVERIKSPSPDTDGGRIQSRNGLLFGVARLNCIGTIDRQPIK